ncbi:MAG: hypothetical protein ACOYVK_13385 [Bacillota bacterium]
MKKVLLVLLLLVTITLHRDVIFASESRDDEENRYIEESKRIEMLFKERADIWNRIYDENVNMDVIMQELDKVVMEPLYTYDLSSFELAKEYPTDLDKVIRVEVVNIKNLEKSDKELKGNVEMLWKMQGFEGTYEEIIAYSVILKLHNGKWKISDYSLCDE